MNKKPQNIKFRFMNYRKAAKEFGCDTATISRKVKAKKIKGGLFSVFIKDDKGVFHETELTIKLIDTNELY